MLYFIRQIENSGRMQQRICNMLLEVILTVLMFGRYDLFYAQFQQFLVFISINISDELGVNFHLQALALAYQQLGMLTAALKVCINFQSCFFITPLSHRFIINVCFFQAYDRAINLQHNPIFALQQSGNVLLTLGLYRKVSVFI